MLDLGSGVEGDIVQITNTVGDGIHSAIVKATRPA